MTTSLSNSALVPDEPVGIAVPSRRAKGPRSSGGTWSRWRRAIVRGLPVDTRGVCPWISPAWISLAAYTMTTTLLDRRPRGGAGLLFAEEGAERRRDHGRTFGGNIPARFGPRVRQFFPAAAPGAGRHRTPVRRGLPDCSPSPASARAAPRAAVPLPSRPRATACTPGAADERCESVSPEWQRPKRRGAGGGN